MAQHVLDKANFRVIFPEFANAAAFPAGYPDAMLQAFWDVGVTYLGDYDGCLLSGPPLQSALNFMAAHLLKLSTMAAFGQTPAILTQARVDKVDVQLAAPPAKNAWAWWLNLTPYGVQLWALLSVKSAGGLYLGGSFARGGFRGPTGRWGG
jgi:hypothetical protein